MLCLVSDPLVPISFSIISQLIKGRVVVGHGLKNDFRALKLKHPRRDQRDTAAFGPLKRAGRPRPLRELAAEHLGLEIQSGKAGHSPLEDARAALYLYHKHRSAWEAGERKGKGKGKPAGGGAAGKADAGDAGEGGEAENGGGGGGGLALFVNE